MYLDRKQKNHFHGSLVRINEFFFCSPYTHTYGKTYEGSDLVGIIEYEYTLISIRDKPII